MQERCGEAFMDCFGKVRHEESGRAKYEIAAGAR